ncbi:MAG: (Fe-S)-binding protein, partial [Gammaproteobacteria bacterium]
MAPYLDWSSYKDAGMGDAYADIPKHGGDYAKAIAVCINSGQCETDNKQVMCPSFKVSGDSHLSTGGRVRLLKAALSSDDWQEALADPELARAMDLCVSCKGCKRECDNNVDMALIKAEYLAWRAQSQRLSLRSRLFAHTPRLLYHLPALRHLIAWRNRSSWLRALSEKWLGLSKAMPLPVPTAEPFSGQAVENTTEPMGQQQA